MTPADELRAEIRRAAANKGMRTQGELAEALGLSGAYLTDIFKSRRRLTPEIVRRAAAVLAVQPARALRWQKLGALESGWQIDGKAA